jgi:tetratricopeptide (TPR) repeat protein
MTFSAVPDELNGVAARVDVLRKLYEMTNAETAARAALAQFPADSRLWLSLGRVLLGTHRADSALDAFSKAGTLDPTDDQPVAWHVAALSVLRRYDEAISSARNALDLFPASSTLHVALGRVFLDSSHPEDSLAYFTQAASLEPGNIAAVHWKVVGLLQLYQPEDAEGLARQLVTKQPQAGRAHYLLGRVLLDMDHNDEAVQSFDRALAIDPRNADALERRVDALRSMRRYADAERAATQAIDVMPRNPRLYLQRAWTLSARDRYDDAVADADRALAIDPRDPWALASRIDFLRFARRFDDAEQAAGEAVDRRPDDPGIHVIIGQLYGGLDRHQDALDSFDRALAIDPRDPWALASRIDFLRSARRFDDAEQAAGEAVDRRPDDPGIHVTIGQLYGDLDRHQDALDSFDRALAIDPRDPGALRERIISLTLLRRFDDAEQAASEAVDRRPDDPGIHVTIGQLYGDLDRHQDALDSFDRALAIDPRNADALERRVAALWSMRRYADAERAATQAIDVMPRNPRLYLQRAWTLSGRDRYDDAVADADRALAIDPRDPWALASRIDFLGFARRYQDAEQAVREAVDRRPDDPGIHVTIGQLYGDLDRHQDALDSFDRALAIDPRDPWALGGRISLLAYLCRFDDAEQAAREALDRRPDDPDIHIALGRVYDYRRSFDDALACYAVALQYEPNSADAYIGRSAALRSLHRCDEAIRDIERLAQRQPYDQRLKAEIGWIHHDARRLGEAKRVFQHLLEAAVNDAERSKARQGLGWTAFADDDYTQAESEFRGACAGDPEADEYRLALAWALARKGGAGRLAEAEQLAYYVSEHRPDPSAHICLGVVAFRRGVLASAEYHLKKALAIDPYHGSDTDLGALFTQMGRYAEAEEQLNKAITKDWYDAAAHIELGVLVLYLGDERLPDAEREFRQALAVDPSSGTAAIGLAQTLERSGVDSESELVLRNVLQRQDTDQRWRVHLALARLLLQRGDKEQSPELCAEAYTQARKAIELAPDAEADPHLVAGIAQHRMGAVGADIRGRFGYRRRALQHLRQCLRRDPGNAQAQRNMQLLEREITATAPAVWGGYAVATISFLLLATMWTTFFLTHKVTTVLLTAMTPVLVGLFTIAALLPSLIRLKLPGFEADLEAGTGSISPGPTGDVTFGPGRFTVSAGPAGQLPRRE